jgi:ribosomal protein S14
MRPRSPWPWHTAKYVRRLWTRRVAADLAKPVVSPRTAEAPVAHHHRCGTAPRHRSFSSATRMGRLAFRHYAGSSPTELDTLTVNGSARRSMSRGARTVTALAGSDDPPLGHVRVAHYQPPVAPAQRGRASEGIGASTSACDAANIRCAPSRTSWSARSWPCPCLVRLHSGCRLPPPSDACVPTPAEPVIQELRHHHIRAAGLRLWLIRNCSNR